MGHSNSWRIQPARSWSIKQARHYHPPMPNTQYETRWMFTVIESTMFVCNVRGADMSDLCQHSFAKMNSATGICNNMLSFQLLRPLTLHTNIVFSQIDKIEPQGTLLNWPYPNAYWYYFDTKVAAFGFLTRLFSGNNSKWSIIGEIRRNYLSPV